MNRSKVKSKSVQILCTRLPSSVPIMSSNDNLTTCFWLLQYSNHRSSLSHLLCLPLPSKHLDVFNSAPFIVSLVAQTAKNPPVMRETRV